MDDQINFFLCVNPPSTLFFIFPRGYNIKIGKMGSEIRNMTSPKVLFSPTPIFIPGEHTDKLE